MIVSRKLTVLRKIMTIFAEITHLMKQYTHFIAVLFSATFLISCKCDLEPVDYVNPYMGNISILLQPTRPTIQLPNSLVRVYPSRGDHASDRLSGLPVITTMHRERTAFSICPFSGEIKDNPQYSYDR